MVSFAFKALLIVGVLHFYRPWTLWKPIIFRNEKSFKETDMAHLLKTDIMETNDPGETETAPTFPIEPENTEKYSPANFERITIPTNLLGQRVKYCKDYSPLTFRCVFPNWRISPFKKIMRETERS